jgi:hypothetical protein
LGFESFFARLANQKRRGKQTTPPQSAERPKYESPKMDELLKQALCSIGIAYLVVRIGQSATSFVAGLVSRRTPTGSNPINSDRR